MLTFDEVLKQTEVTKEYVWVPFLYADGLNLLDFDFVNAQHFNRKNSMIHRIDNEGNWLVLAEYNAYDHIRNAIITEYQLFTINENDKNSKEIIQAHQIQLSKLMDCF